ncbi:MAG: DUF1517 domain-containing protein [Polyangiales bacterium]
MGPRARGLWLFVAATLAATASNAQLTGGRFGGSSWGQPSAQAPAPAPTPPPAVPAMPIAPPPPPMMPDPAVPAAPGVVPVPEAPAPPAPPAPRVRPTTYRPYAHGSPGRIASTAEERSPTEAETRLATPSLNLVWTSGPVKPSWPLAAGGATFVVMLGLTLLATRQRPGARRVASGGLAQPTATPGVVPTLHPGVEFRRVTVAIDHSARAAVQSSLAALAARVDAASPAGLHAAAEATRDALTQARGAIRYGVATARSLSEAAGQAAFAAQADELRGRYTVETVGRARNAGPKLAPRPEEGGGLVVVSVLVAARGALPVAPSGHDLASLMGALHAMVPPRADRLLALEVIWSPSEDADRMSSAELEFLYPELRRVDDAMAFGRVVCGHCRAVYAAELGRCPACGAPRG